MAAKKPVYGEDMSHESERDPYRACPLEKVVRRKSNAARVLWQMTCRCRKSEMEAGDLGWITRAGVWIARQKVRYLLRPIG